MKRLKEFFYETAVVWLFIIFVGVLFGLPSWGELSLEWIRLTLFNARTYVILFVLAVAMVILSRLRYRFAWSVVLIVLAILGSGIYLPQRFVLYPEQPSIMRVSLTFIAILAFWILEKLESKYVGSDNSGVGTEGSLMEEDEIVTLNLDDESLYKKNAVSKN